MAWKRKLSTYDLVLIGIAAATLFLASPFGLVLQAMLIFLLIGIPLLAFTGLLLNVALYLLPGRLFEAGLLAAMPGAIGGWQRWMLRFFSIALAAGILNTYAWYQGHRVQSAAVALVENDRDAEATVQQTAGIKTLATVNNAPNQYCGELCTRLLLNGSVKHFLVVRTKLLPEPISGEMTGALWFLESRTTCPEPERWMTRLNWYLPADSYSVYTQEDTGKNLPWHEADMALKHALKGGTCLLKRTAKLSTADLVIASGKLVDQGKRSGGRAYMRAKRWEILRKENNRLKAVARQTHTQYSTLSLPLQFTLASQGNTLQFKPVFARGERVAGSEPSKSRRGKEQFRAFVAKHFSLDISLPDNHPGSTTSRIGDAPVSRGNSIAFPPNIERAFGISRKKDHPRRDLIDQFRRALGQSVQNWDDKHSHLRSSRFWHAVMAADDIDLEDVALASRLINDSRVIMYHRKTLGSAVRKLAEHSVTAREMLLLALLTPRKRPDGIETKRYSSVSFAWNGHRKRWMFELITSLGPEAIKTHAGALAPLFAKARYAFEADGLIAAYAQSGSASTIDFVRLLDFSDAYPSGGSLPVVPYYVASMRGFCSTPGPLNGAADLLATRLLNETLTQKSRLPELTYLALLRQGVDRNLLDREFISLASAEKLTSWANGPDSHARCGELAAETYKTL